MTTTLSALLDTPELGLALVSGASEVAVTWVHNSDLVDPTPWLEPGQLLLTDGTQFPLEVPAAEAESYIARLQAAGVVALGFATNVAHESIPAALVATCARLDFPLVEVTARTPFIAIIRHVADLASAEARARLEWSQAAQRSLARAALRPDALGAILRELERSLSTWVRLYDAAGEPVDAGTRHRMPPLLEPEVTSAARAALRRARPFGGRLVLGEAGATLQTVGRSGELRGVLVVGTDAPLDAAGNDLVSSVIGLASIALEQGRALEDARLHVRSGVLELALHGNLDVASRTASRLWGPLPAAPLRVAIVAAEGASRLLIEELGRVADRRAAGLFFAERDGDLVLVVPDAEAPTLAEVLARHDTCAGLSTPLQWSELDRGLVEARRAARSCGRGTATGAGGGPAGAHAGAYDGALVPFESLASAGMMGLLTASDPAPVAARVLAPVVTSPNPDHAALLPSATVWLAHNGAWEPAARELGVHRHTLRARIRTLEGLLGLDLERFGDRAELWAALQFVDAATTP